MNTLMSVIKNIHCRDIFRKILCSRLLTLCHYTKIICIQTILIMHADFIFSVDENSQSFETPRKTITVSLHKWPMFFLVYYDAQPFETPRINNHSVTVPSAHILLVGDDAQSFETLQKQSQCHCTK